jgi:GNAT superfamily N-acetyltransferase
MPQIIRRATKSDVPRLIEMYQQLSLDNPREDLGPPLPSGYAETFRMIDADPKQHVLVADLDGRVVGSLVLIIVPNLSHQGTPWAEIENMVVDETVRGRRIGESLVQRAIHIARDAGCYKLTLTSNMRRTEAHRFYERMGFETTHRAFRMTF